METHDMNANRLQTEERKIQWLENEIKDLEYVLTSDCINRNNKLCRLQMYRELLAIKQAQINEPMSEQETLGKLKVNVLNHDWNDVSNTKIPLNKQIFALLEDRHDPEKLRPEVIVARMMPAKRLTWTKNKEGNVLCYDVPTGNYHSCNGNQIKYWKHVNAPSGL